jgi:hypothetical protein
MSIDMYSYSHVVDPIVQGFIGESGAATTCGLIGNQSFISWANVSTQLGCGTGASSVSCMKQKSEAQISAVAGTLQTGWVPSFAPSPDGILVFDDYDARGARGEFAKKVRPIHDIEQSLEFWTWTPQTAEKRLLTRFCKSAVPHRKQ